MEDLRVWSRLSLITTSRKALAQLTERIESRPFRGPVPSWKLKTFDMRIALVASPFISVPPKEYGGTELFIADLANGLQALGVDVTVYANGESTVDVNKRWLFPNSQWPIKDDG